MISFVYFDVGGVAMSDFSSTNKWTLMKRDIGIKPEADGEFNKFWDKYEKKVNMGRDVDTLIPLIAEKFHINFPAGYSFLTDFINRFEPNKSIWPIIDMVSKDCKIGLLTNMYPGMLPAMIKKGLIPLIPWNIIVNSSIEGCIKPNLDIFRIAEKKSGTKKENILFIDNMIENIAAAKDFGWQTFLYDSSDYNKSSSRLLEYYKRII